MAPEEGVLIGRPRKYPGTPEPLQAIPDPKFGATAGGRAASQTRIGKREPFSLRRLGTPDEHGRHPVSAPGLDVCADGVHGHHRDDAEATAVVVVRRRRAPSEAAKCGLGLGEDTVVAGTAAAAERTLALGAEDGGS